MGARVTARIPGGVAYVGNRVKFRDIPELNTAGSLRVGAVREILELLADYEDTGLTPEQIKELMQANLRKS